MGIKQLWVESHRPATLDGYVFKDENQKRQIESWIKAKAIPNCMFSGGPGTGKCLLGNELIDIKIKRYLISDEQLYLCESYQFDGDDVQCVLPIETLFDILKLQHILYETPTAVDGLQILSPSGYVPVLHLVKKHHLTSTFKLENNLSIGCSIKHRVFENGKVKNIEDCETVDSINGPLRIIEKGKTTYHDVFDVSLNYPHQYVTPNGIIHHNTTLAKILVNALQIDEYDFMQINASRERGIDVIRETVKNFSQTMPFGDLKIILLDEADAITPEGQASLRGAMEEYSESVRFILTCNYPNKIIPALHSRCQGFHIDKLDQTEFTTRVATILISENIEFDIDVLDSFVKATYPDLRKCLNLVQQNSIDGKLNNPATTDRSVSDYKLDAVNLFKKGKIREARTLICSQLRPEEMDDMFRWCYENLELWGTTVEDQDEAIMIIRRALVNHALVADAEINVAAMFVELSQIGR
jgi:replication factor C small subunit